MKLLILICGAAGAGKTTLAQTICRSNEQSSYVEADHFMSDSQGNYKFDPARLGYCHGKCKEFAEERMKNARSKEIVIVSNTSLTPAERKPYLDLAAKYGFKVQEIFMRSPFKSVHNVPAEKVEEMKRKLSLG